MFKILSISFFFIVGNFSSSFAYATEKNKTDESVLSQIIEQSVLSSYQKLILNSYTFYKQHLRFHAKTPAVTINKFPVILPLTLNGNIVFDQKFHSAQFFREMAVSSEFAEKNSPRENILVANKLANNKTNIIKISNAPVYEGFVSSAFGLRKDPIHGNRRMHKGIDIAASMGAEVNPLGPGEVIYSGYKSGYGNTVEIKHGRTVITRYAHLQKFLVDSGQQVKVTDTIGLIGSTGRSTGPHLHLEVLFNNKQVDPQVFLVNHYGSGTYNYAKLDQAKSKKLKNKKAQNLAKLESKDRIALVNNDAKTKNAETNTSVDIRADKTAFDNAASDIDISDINTANNNAPQVAYQDYVNSINGLYGFSAPVSFDQ